jgi:phosphatidylglycerol lysyltransferase
VSIGANDGTHTLLRAWFPPAVAALLFILMLWILHRELQDIHYHDVREALIALPSGHILLALLFTAANFLALTGYDQLAFIHVGKRISRWRIALTAFVSYAVSNSVGFALLSGTAVRHRFYSRWGVATADLSRIIILNYTTYWLGLLALAGWSLIFHPPASLQGGLAQGSAQWLGGAFMVMVAGYLILSMVRAAPLRVHGFEMRMPRLPLALGQLLLSMTDWALAAAVLYALLPEGGPPYEVLLGAFIAAQVLGLISNVPGGLGVFEGVIVLLLGPYLTADRLIAALLLYRLVYYVIPLTLALLVLLTDELRNRRVQLARLGKSMGSYSVQFAPKILAVFTFMAGLLLLVSGATPAEHERLHWLAQVMPVGLFEASHFLGSLVGMGLLVLAQAVSRRVQVAYYLVLAALLAGIATSLLKAADWEEALLLSLLLLAFAPSHGFFDRQAALFDTRFSPGWIVAIVATLGASVWLGVFAFRHVEYSNDLWWQVELNQDAPRFLRATLGAAIALLGFGTWRLLRISPHFTEPPSDKDIADAQRVIATQSHTLPFLAYLRDKALLFNADRSAFVMYGVHGRTWAALGDPVGPATAAPDLVRAFVERADDYGGVPVFYQVHPAQLHLYAELGMSFAKLGEEGHVPLEEFSLEGRRNRELRSAMNRLVREKVNFRIIEAAAVPPVLPQLKAVSDDWLTRKSVSEKGFSVGFFDVDYLSRMPVAVLERDGRILAFANLLCDPSGKELSVDLMRFAATAPSGTMDVLFTHLFLWGRDHDYRWFNLGMAPLSGLHPLPIAPLWPRLGRFVYQYGETFYNFEGLRAYKNKFHPVWESRYLAYPGGLALPGVLTDITALAAGGYLRIFR